MKLLHHSVFSLPPNILFTPPHPLFLLPHLTSSLYKPTIIHSLSVHRLCSEPEPWLSQFAGSPIVAAAIFDPSDVGGPVELPPDAPSVFAVADEPGALQVGYSILLFGAVTFFVFRSLRRRAKRAKELRFRSSGVKKTLKDEALENLKAIENLSVKPGSPPSPAQALLGGLTAGVIALVLYKFTATVETTLSRQVVSDNYSVCCSTAHHCFLYSCLLIVIMLSMLANLNSCD
ncbi:hypothetical protein Dimus_018912 [Dionaea muscipula]